MTKIVIGIPSGQRAEKLKATAMSWKTSGLFVAVYCWDRESYESIDMIADFRCLGNREPFGKLHNFLMKTVMDWDIYICGADDLWPTNNFKDGIKKVIKLYPNKVYCVPDGIHTHLPTHPVIHRGWYDKQENKNIFDEKFTHNFVDTDLLCRLAPKGDIIQVSGVRFDHRHPIKTGEKVDAVYQIGNDSYSADRLYFEAKHGNNTIVNQCQQMLKTVVI